MLAEGEHDTVAKVQIYLAASWMAETLGQGSDFV
jgi:hypothetical protein